MAHNEISFGDRNIGLQVGQSFAPINAEIHLPLDQPETPPAPSSTIPFRRDPDFIVRQILLDQLHEKCAAPAARTAVVGLGGVGKSQLAIEYSYQVRCQSPETWVFWVHASNAARFEQSYGEIADHVKIPGRKNSKADIFKLVHDWLRDERNGKWFLVLDNADDARWLLETHMSHERSARPLWEYLPQSQHGSVLVTTRSRSVALKLVEERDIVAVEPMDEAHAVALFERKLSTKSDREYIVELVAALEFMPLAVVQAAAYINQRTPRCSVRQYIEKFQKTDRNKTSLLAHEAGHLRRDREAKNSIIITWQISFDYIHQERPSAADLLSLMSFFDRQGISEDLLRSGGEAGNSNRDFDNQDGNSNGHDEEDSRSETSVTDEFEDDILMLRNYSFIFVNIVESTFGMHRLVQLATRKWLEAHRQLERWKQQYIKRLCAEFPTGKYENWAKCGALFPHVQLALAQQPEGDDSLREWALLLYNAAWYALLRGSSSDAEKMSVKSMKVTKKQLGQDDKETLSSQTMVALAYIVGGRWKEAEELEVQVIETKKRVLGQEHQNTLASMNNLALAFQNQGRWKEAEELGVQVMETSSRVLGQEHPDTLTSIANLASTFWNQKRWKEAEELGVQVMETRKRVLGQEHPSTLASMNNLAYTWKNQNRDAEALDLLSSCLKLSRRKLGANHPNTLACAQTYNAWKME
ncbi:related to kinesin light chain [Phialocephala subalpina]|uniref:Related to kinesin light chain n=1 Tax=Phialocephala subalpina TaxID=576137 RepID=A0A1L7WES2_9HELO|nr:related to kinesin light chain [Phialocephala subalpina]